MLALLALARYAVVEEAMIMAHASTVTTESFMARERRGRRSTNRREALHLLLQSVRERSGIASIAVVDARGHVIAGEGSEHDLFILGSVAASAASGAFDATCERLTAGTDVVSCPVAIGEERLYLAALGDHVSRMPEAARGVVRILS